MRGSDLAAVKAAPLDVFVPPDGALPALVPPHVEAAAEVLRDGAAPPGLLDRAIDGVDLVPALLWRDLREIRRGEGGGGPRGRARSAAAAQEGRGGGERGGGVGGGQGRGVGESDADAVHADRPVEVGGRVLKVREQRHAARRACLASVL